MRRALAPCLALCLALGLVACASFPEIDARIPAAERIGPPPPLVPLGPILALADAPTHPDPTPALASRADRLAARAAALRGPVLTPEEAARLGSDPAD